MASLTTIVGMIPLIGGSDVTGHWLLQLLGGLTAGHNNNIDAIASVMIRYFLKLKTPKEALI